jgi:hypothetical protein
LTRQKDIADIQQSLESYATKNSGEYPTGIESGTYKEICGEIIDTNCVNLSILVPNYINRIPKDPNSNNYFIAINPINDSISVWAKSAEQREVAINFFDKDAAAYILAVQSADGQSLEPKVRSAITNFIIGCKSDGIWESIKSSAIFSGARTINGALIPLVGVSPTQFQFTGTDGGWTYDRKQGLRSNGKNYLRINRLNNADPQNNNHNALYVSAYSSGVVLGTFNLTDPRNTISSAAVRNRGNAYFNNAVIGFIGHSRNNSDSFEYRNNSLTNQINNVSGTPLETNLLLFRDGPTDGVAVNQSIVSFYSVGEALDLNKLDNRVTQLMLDFNNAIIQ